ncbi:MAG: UMP kinase [bacterium]|nr:UMP kinase [bacterium]
MEKETVVISLGGSLIIPNEIDVSFLKDFKELILSFVQQNKRFVLITGGGKICRKYNEAATQISNIKNDELDWLGIYSTRFNAEFVKLIFSEHADKDIILDPMLPLSSEKPILVGGGWKPGNSTDLVAVSIAKNIRAKKIINLSNTDYVYDKDPRTNPDAKKIEKISWAEYRKLIPEEWNPGLNSPFDPIASKIAEEEGITVMTMNGNPIDNLANALLGKEFLGTTIY